MQFKVDRLQSKLDRKSCVGKKIMKKINVKKSKMEGKKGSNEGETVK